MVSVVLPEMPVTVTVPVSGGAEVVPPPPPVLLLPPQLRLAANKTARTPPSVTCRRFHAGLAAGLRRYLYKATSIRQSRAMPTTHRPPMRGPPRNAG